MGSDRGKQAAVQLLTIAGIFVCWMMRVAAFLPALCLDVATHQVGRGLAALRAVNNDGAKQQAIRVFSALGATFGALLLVTVAATAVVVLSQPEMPYPRTTLYDRGQNPGPILIEFGPR